MMRLKGGVGIYSGIMKSLKEMLRESEEHSHKAHAFSNRFRKENGSDVFIPGHVTDFIERDAKTDVKFDPDTYTRMNNRVRNTKSKKTYDIHHTVTNKHIKHKTSVVDKR